MKKLLALCLLALTGCETEVIVGPSCMNNGSSKVVVFKTGINEPARQLFPGNTVCTASGVFSIVD